MSVYVNNFTIETGAYFSRDFYLDNSNGTSLDLTGYSAKSYLRKHSESVNATSIFNVENTKLYGYFNDNYLMK